MRKFLTTCWFTILIVLDFILTLLSNIVFGGLLWITITFLSLFTYMFGGLKHLRTFYMQLGQGQIKFIPNLFKISKN